MGEIKHIASIDAGRLKFKNEAVFRQKIFDVYSANSVEVKITYGNKRSLDQNAYMYGGICDPIALRLWQDGWNFDSYEVYKFLENKFSKHEYVNEKTGETAWRTKPLKKLDTKQFSDVIEEIRMWSMHDLDLYLKTPAQYYELTEAAYEDWKNRIISFDEAKKQSKGNFIIEPLCEL